MDPRFRLEYLRYFRRWEIVVNAGRMGQGRVFACSMDKHSAHWLPLAYISLHCIGPNCFSSSSIALLHYSTHYSILLLSPRIWNFHDRSGKGKGVGRDVQTMDQSDASPRHLRSI